MTSVRYVATKSTIGECIECGFVDATWRYGEDDKPVLVCTHCKRELNLKTCRTAKEEVPDGV